MQITPSPLRPPHVLAASAAIVGLFAATAPSIAAAEEVPIACGTVVTTDVRLHADLLDCAGPGLVVGAPGITIDLAGHVVDGTGTGTGIDNSAGHNDVRIRRGTVREFQFGVHLFQTDGALVERVASEANTIGVIVERSTAGELDRVTATANAFNGIEVTFSDGITVRRSTAADNGHGGIFDVASVDSRYERNTAAGNVAPGLALWQSDGAVVERNHAVGNDSNGIELTGVDDAVVERNDAIANNGDGIVVDEPGITLVRNRAVGNQGIGIAAPDGTIDGGRNHASGNAAGDCMGVACG